MTEHSTDCQSHSDRAPGGSLQRRLVGLLGGVAGIVLVVAIVGLANPGGSVGTAPTEDRVQNTEIRYDQDDVSERMTLGLSGPLPDDRVTEVEDITDVTTRGVGFAVQDPSAHWLCGDRHFGYQPPRPPGTPGPVTLLVPSHWLDLSESIPPVVVDESLGGDVPKVLACTHNGYMQVILTAPRPYADIKVSVEHDPARVMVELTR